MTISKGWNEGQGQVEGTCHCACVNCHTDCLSATVCTQDSHDVCTAPHGSLSELVLMYTDRTPPATQITLSLRSQSPAVLFNVVEETLALPSTRISSKKGGWQAGLSLQANWANNGLFHPCWRPSRRAWWHICALTRGGHEQQQRREEGLVSILLPWWNSSDQSQAWTWSARTGFSSSVIGDRRRASLWWVANWRHVMEGAGGFLVNYIPHCGSASEKCPKTVL